MMKVPHGKNSVVAALDIGSGKVACLIGRIVDDAGSVDVIGVGHQAAQGIKGGSIIDLDAAEASIRRAVHAAEDMAASELNGYPLRDVVISVPANLCQSHFFHVDVDIDGHEVIDHDINRALSKAYERDFGEDELIHIIPTSYSIDNQDGIRDPRGMFGKDLKVDIHAVTANAAALKNITTCLNRSHLDVSAFCMSVYAAGLSSMVEDEMDLGCTVIDMGAGVTSLAVFQDGSMVYGSGIPAGGMHVTNDVACGLTTSLADAERLKTLYGSAVSFSTDESELIDVPQIGEDEHVNPNHVPRSMLVGVIQPRVEEIFELIRGKMDESGLASSIGRRVVLTGGASQLSGVRELAQLILDKQVRLGKPIRISGLAESMSGPTFATTVGLLNYVATRSDEQPGDRMGGVDAGTLWQRVRLWLRDNW